jgi:DNA-binding PadR family transcriptional regulator
MSCVSGLSSVLGAFHAFSYGSLYPCLKELLGRGLIAEEEADPSPRARAGRRSKIVYRLTADGKDRLHELLSEAGPTSWDDDGFGVHFAFFGQTRADVRLRILEGRRSRLEERMEAVRAACRGPGNAWTATPSSCRGTASSRSSEKSAG